ncbi:MAG: hypothetical protein RLZZ519_1378 [Bacteroidota bacterium]
MVATVDAMLDQDFCSFLEYELCKAFEHSQLGSIRGFWCDGVLLRQPKLADAQKFVNDNRRMSFTAYVGKDGQTEYELILKFGNKALSRFARNLDIRECFPDPQGASWFDIDTKRKRIEIQLA